MLPFNLQGGEEDVAILTTCNLPSRNDAIHLTKQGWTSNKLYTEPEKGLWQPLNAADLDDMAMRQLPRYKRIPP